MDRLNRLPEQPLTDAEKLRVFKAWTLRLPALVANPVTDDELERKLMACFAVSSEMAAPDFPQSCCRPETLSIWAGHIYWLPDGNTPIFAGKATMEMARKVYGLQTPAQYREPTLFEMGAQ